MEGVWQGRKGWGMRRVGTPPAVCRLQWGVQVQRDFWRALHGGRLASLRPNACLPGDRQLRPHPWLLIVAGTQVVAGEGMPLTKAPGQRGNLRIKFEPVFPRALSDQQKAALQQVLPSQ